MKETTRWVITFILAYAITRTGKWLFNFDPVSYFPGIIGYAVDIAIWLLLCFAIMFLLKKFIKAGLAKS